MKTIVHYQCEGCGAEYATEAFAEACEASTPSPPFAVGDEVLYNHYEWQGTVLKVKALLLRPRLQFVSFDARDIANARHHWAVELHAVNENGCNIVTRPSWLTPVKPVSAAPLK
jgi:hypothetical protein